MSHFTVLVIGENPEEQLKPFDENLEVVRYVEYTKEQVIEKGKKEIEEYKNGMYADYLKDPKKYSKDSGGSHLDYISKKFPEKLNWSDEQIYKDQIEFYEEEDIGKDGEIYSERNKNSKWDWYSIGGRWSGSLRLKEGCNGELEEPDILMICEELDNDKKERYKENKERNCVDSALKKDIDFSLDEEIYDRSIRKWELAVEGKKSKNKEEKEILKWELHNKSYYIEKFGTKEEYAKLQSEFTTYAVLMNGEWFEAGQMGWFGCSSASPKEEGEFKKNFYDRFIKTLPDDTKLTVVDCHI